MDVLDYLRFSKKNHRLSSGINLVYFENCSAGAEEYSDQVLSVLSEMSGHRKYQRAYEHWCGHGVYAFDILGKNIADSIALSDCFFPAVVSCEFTASCNAIDEKVSVYQLDCVSHLPESEMFDMAIGNPPWYGGYDNDRDLYNEDAARICIDDGFKSHQDFFDNISVHLYEGADLFLFHIYDPTEICNVPKELEFKSSRKVLELPNGTARLWHFVKRPLI